MMNLHCLKNAPNIMVRAYPQLYDPMMKEAVTLRRSLSLISHTKGWTDRQELMVAYPAKNCHEKSD